MIKKIAFGLLMSLMIFGQALAADLPMVGLTVDKAEIKAGDNITYTISYDNISGEDLSDVVVGLDVEVANGIDFVGSSLPQYWNGSKPYWRINNLSDGDQSTITITLNVSDEYIGKSIAGTAELSGDANGGLISVGSNAAAVNLTSLDEKVAEKDEEKKVDAETKVDDKITETTKETEISMTAKGGKSLVVENVVGGADLSNYEENINKWDSRFLWVGLVSVSLILIIGILGFVLGRKVK